MQNLILLKKLYDDEAEKIKERLKNENEKSKKKKVIDWEKRNKINREKYAGYSDWRVPSVKELLTLARPASQREFYKSFFGGSRTENYWSSNSVSSSVKSYVSMDDGTAVSGSSEGMGFQYGGTKLIGFSVRLVRNIK